MPLWEAGVEEVHQKLRSSSRKWRDLAVASCGTYLGYVEGPGKQDKGWEKPIKKYVDRCANWAATGGGLQYSTVAYNTFAISVLTFVSQLELPPKTATDAKQKCIRVMLPGPGNWCTSQDTFFLREFYGQHKSFQSLEVLAQAAKLRILHAHDSYRRTHVNNDIRSVEYMRTQLEHLRDNTAQAARADAWKGWYDKSHVAVLVSNRRKLEAEGIQLKHVLNDIA